MSMPRAAKNPRESRDDPGLVDADDVHRVGDHVLADSALSRAAHLDRDARGLRELREVGLDARNRCQLPATSIRIAKSEPSAVMRLSLMLPPQSATTFESRARDRCGRRRWRILR